MLLLVGMSKKIQTKIQNQPNIFLYPDHAFQWKVLLSASMNIRKREKSRRILYSSEMPSLKWTKRFTKTHVV